VEKHRRYLEDQERQLQDTQQQIDLCFRANNEKLARVMVRRNLEVQKRIKLAERERDALRIEQERIGTEVADQKNKLVSIRERMEIFSDDAQHRSSVQEESTRFNDHVVSEEEVEIAFLAERERRANAAPTEGGPKKGAV
jgi:phage shock protein A